MEVRAGYKQTEVGVIPEDWGVEALGTLGQLEMGKGLLKGDIAQFGELQAIPYTSLYTDFSEIIEPKNIKWFTKAISAPFVVYEPCVLLASSSNVSKNTGKACALINGFPIAVGREVISLKTKQNVLYISYQLSTRGYRKRTLELAKGITIKHVYPTTFHDYKIALPSGPEQRAIAAALSDVDALLGGLDRLIAKKRDLKQATMQQLLTGQTRLPGFSGEWGLCVLGNVVEELVAGVSVNSTDDDLLPGAPCVLKTSALSGGTFLPHEAKRIAPQDWSRARVNPTHNSILISRMNTPDLVGEIAYVGCDHHWLYLPDRIWMTRFRSGAGLDARWLAYVLSSSTYKKLLKGVATGTSGSMKNISKDALLSLPIRFPVEEEQTAIAAVLSDMDAELSALEARRDKTRALKQAMMQELLTGRIRLV